MHECYLQQWNLLGAERFLLVALCSPRNVLEVHRRKFPDQILASFQNVFLFLEEHHVKKWFWIALKQATNAHFSYQDLEYLHDSSKFQLEINSSQHHLDPKPYFAAFEDDYQTGKLVQIACQHS